MKNILIPTDFSSNAWNALHYATALFKEEPCTFYVLHTYTPSIAYSRFMADAAGTTTVTQDVGAISKTSLATVIAKIQKIAPNKNHNFVTRSSFNLLVEEIKEMVAEHQIDLIVLGTKGASGLSEVFMGSNTVRIIKGVTDCPVLAIPENFKFTQIREIAFATNFNRFYTPSELAQIINLSKSFKAAIRVVYVQEKIQALTDVQQFNLHMLRKYLTGLNYYIHTISKGASVAVTLEVFTEELGIHLLAMLNYKHSYVERLTREPIVKQLAFHTEIPLLIIPELSKHIG